MKILSSVRSVILSAFTLAASPALADDWDFVGGLEGCAGSEGEVFSLKACGSVSNKAPKSPTLNSLAVLPKGVAAYAPEGGVPFSVRSDTPEIHGTVAGETEIFSSGSWEVSTGFKAGAGFQSATGTINVWDTLERFREATRHQLAAEIRKNISGQLANAERALRAQSVIPTPAGDQNLEDMGRQAANDFTGRLANIMADQLMANPSAPGFDLTPLIPQDIPELNLRQLAGRLMNNGNARELMANHGIKGNLNAVSNKKLRPLVRKLLERAGEELGKKIPANVRNQLEKLRQAEDITEISTTIISGEWFPYIKLEKDIANDLSFYVLVGGGLNALAYLNDGQQSFGCVGPSVFGEVGIKGALSDGTQVGASVGLRHDFKMECPGAGSMPGRYQKTAAVSVILKF